MKYDYEKVVRLERAIGQEWGQTTVENPKSWWNEEKEKKYLEQLKNFNLDTEAKTEEVSEGIYIEKKLLNKRKTLFCPVCKNKIKTIKDDILINKFECCEKCYIEFVEGREDRWQTGWRPKNVTRNIRDS